MNPEKKKIKHAGHCNFLNYFYYWVQINAKNSFFVLCPFRFFSNRKNEQKKKKYRDKKRMNECVIICVHACDYIVSTNIYARL